MDRSQRPGAVLDVVKVGDVDVLFADPDALCGSERGAAAGKAAARGPKLLATWKGAEVCDVGVDDLLGPTYEEMGRQPLRDWKNAPVGDWPTLSAASDPWDDPSSSFSLNGGGSAGGASDAPPQSADAEDAVSDDGGEVHADKGAGGGAERGATQQKARRSRRAGTGRARGEALDVRASFEDIIFVLFCRQLIATLKLRDGVDAESENLLKLTIARLITERAKYPRLSNKVLSTKAWTLRRSGCVGAIVQFKDKGAKDNTARDCSIAVEVSLTADDVPVVTCSRGEEDCQRDGCAHGDAVVSALQRVQACAGMGLVDVLGTLSEDLRVSAMNQGIAVLYGKRLCVVRREGGSWPFAVVRRKRNGMWLCHACTQGPSVCTHAQAARDAGNNDQSEASGDDGAINGLGRRGQRRGNLIYSVQPRPLVPSQNSQAKHAEVLRAAALGKRVIIQAPRRCLTCNRKRPRGIPRTMLSGVIEFGTGAVASAVGYWRCVSCKRTCVQEGLEEGLVMCSQYTAYTEVFLFEAAVNLARNASSLTSTYDLRAAFHQLSKEHTLPASLDRLRSLPLFRSTVLLYIYLVIQGLPSALSTCAVCARADGSLRFICFDGLQLGFKLRYRTPFKRIAIKLSPIHRATIMAQMISDSAVARALGSVLSVATTDHEAVREKAVQNLTAVRGHIMALIILSGDVKVPGEAVNLAGATPHASGRSRFRGWDPETDGGVHGALIVFLRELFRCGRAARKVALTVAGAKRTLRRKVPQVLMDHINGVIAKGDMDASSGSDGSDEDDKAGSPQPRRVDLRACSQAVGNPSLLDAGGAAGQRRRDGALLRIIPSIPSTAASTADLVDFTRAVVVDPVVVWAPGGDWSGVHMLVAALVARPFDQYALEKATRHHQVRGQRLLYGAISALYPALCTQPRVRDILVNVLCALCETNERYEAFVRDDAVQALTSSTDGRLKVATAEEMAAADPTATFHPVEYTKSWLEVPASVERYQSLYGLRAAQANNFLLTGEWAPSFPPVRAIPDFLAAAGVAEDRPECNHVMGQENQFTGGTFSASCTCSHPKTVGVVVLDGSEGQRMPIEFVAQRMVTMPDAIIYDFACAALKTSLARLPLLALIITFLVDRFHWFMNHVWCSKAMNPDSYAAADGQNTSASEERNAASRRLQNFLRLVNQRNFILFTVYQQAVGNAIAMHRDVHTPKMEDRWPLWYRKKFVDGVAAPVGDATNDGAAPVPGQLPQNKGEDAQGEEEDAQDSGQGRVEESGEEAGGVSHVEESDERSGTGGQGDPAQSKSEESEG